jgi:peptide/nickel transport system substrate-binding protein
MGWVARKLAASHSRAATTGSILLAIVVMACAAPAAPVGSGPAQPAEQPARFKRIVAGLHGREPTMIWTLTGRLGPAEIVTAGLGNFTHRTELYAELAESIPSLDNGLWKLFPDGRMETTWKLRPGLTWHDGTPLTTDDLLFSYQVASDPEVPYFRHTGLSSIDTVEALDATTIVVKWKRPLASADTMFARGAGGPSFVIPFPKHLLERPYQEQKAQLGDISFWGADYIAAGPFKLKDWVRGSHFTFTAFDNYALGRPKIDEIEVRFIGDVQALISNVLASEVDMSFGVQPVSLEQAVDIESRWPQGHVTKIFTNWVAMFPQFIDPKPVQLRQQPFRQALVHGTDRKLLSETIMHGMTPIADTHLPIESPYAEALKPYVVHYEYDVRKAIALLDGMGLTRGADGFYSDASGQRMDVELRAQSDYAQEPKIVQALPDMWRPIGINGMSTLVPPQQGADRELNATRPAFDVRRYNLQLERLADFSTAQIPLPENRFAGPNRPRYSSPELDALLDRMLVTVPKDEWVKVVGQVLNVMSREVVAQGIFYGADTMLVNNRIKNVVGQSQPSDFERSYLWDLD